MSGTSDSDLIQRMQSGDMEALGGLFARHHERVHAFCARMTGDTDVADDLVQEVFLRLYRYCDRFRGEAELSTWLRRIAHNVCMDHFGAAGRRRDTRKEKAVEDSVPPDRTNGGPDWRVPLLKEALDRITPDHRTVLILSRFHDMRYAEIAEVLEVSEGAVKVRVHRALKQLREVYEMLERGHD